MGCCQRDTPPVGAVGVVGRRVRCELEVQSVGVGVALFGVVSSGKKDSTSLNMPGGSGQFGAVMARELEPGHCPLPVSPSSLRQTGR